MRWLALAVFLVGCGDNVEFVTKPRQAEAVALVWGAQYGMATGAPSVYWVEGAEQNCMDGNRPGFLTSSLGCRGGLARSNAGVIQVVWVDGDSFHVTYMAHEMCHLRSQIETGDGDGDHLGPCFTTGGYVDRANATLSALGM